MVENTYTEVTPDLTWSSSGLTSVSYSLSIYDDSSVLNWVSIDTSTGKLKISAPSVSLITSYTFYVDSVVSGVSATIK